MGLQRYVLSSILILVLISSITLPHLASAYEEDIHYWLKLKLALYCGFSANESRLIATGDEGIDANFPTEPTKISPFENGINPISPASWDNLNIKSKWHALPNDNPVSNPSQGIPEIQQEQDILYKRVADEKNPSTQLIKFGQYLHYVEDKWSHWGYTVGVGHLFANLEGESPDNPGKTSLAVRDMIYDVTTQMGNYPGGQAKKCHNDAFGVDNPFISPINFPNDFASMYPNGTPAVTGVPSQDMSGMRDSYLQSLDGLNPSDKLSDIYNDLVNTAQQATNGGASTDDVISDDSNSLISHIAKELNTDTYTVKNNYGFVSPWNLRGIAGFSFWIFSSNLNQGIHWGEDGNPTENINPNPDQVFSNPQINPTPYVKVPTQPPIVPPKAPPPLPPGQNIPYSPGLKTATVFVIKHVINDGGGTAKASDFKLTIDPGPYLNANPYTFAGSESGTMITLSGKFDQMLHYTVHEPDPNPQGYTVSYTEGCRTYINAGENLTCIVYNTFNPTGHAWYNSGASSSTSVAGNTNTPSNTGTTSAPSTSTSTSGLTTNNVPQIPAWIKNTAKWWSEGQTSDQEYATSIGWLVTNGIINLQSRGTQGAAIIVSSDIQLPSWIKNEASWWAIGAIDDTTYLQSLQYMLDNNIITFSKPGGHIQSGQKFDVTIKAVDSNTGEPVDALVTITVNSLPVTAETDRDGVAHFSLPAGSYDIQIDSQEYQRSSGNIAVTGNTQQTFQLEPMSGGYSSQPSESSSGTTQESQSQSQSQAPPASTSTSSSSTSGNSQSLAVSSTPSSASFVHNIGSSPCPTPITTVTLDSNEQGTWSVGSVPSWISVNLSGNQASISFNCQLAQYVTQSLSGDVQFQFTSSGGQTATSTVSISGQVNQG